MKGREFLPKDPSYAMHAERAQQDTSPSPNKHLTSNLKVSNAVNAFFGLKLLARPTFLSLIAVTEKLDKQERAV